MKKNPVMEIMDGILNIGTNDADDIQKTRLIRQVNGLNSFYLLLAWGLGLLVTFTVENSSYLSIIQFIAGLFYIGNIILNRFQKHKLAGFMTIVVFEWQLFLIMVLSGMYSGSVVYIAILYPLLAALVEVSIFRHMFISLLQGTVMLSVYFFFPSIQTEVDKLIRLTPSALEIIKIMTVIVIPVMAAVIINIIFSENIRAREKQKRLTDELSAANRQLAVYASQLQDEATRLRAEVQVAKILQVMVLPSEEELKTVPDLDISCIMRPADEVGGDYYDVIQMPKQIIFGFGDVTGHGLHSGVIMMMTQTAIRSLAENNPEKPSELIAILNRILYSNILKIKDERSLTLCVFFYKGNGNFILSGQHESPIICRKNGDVEYINTMELGYYVGMLPDIEDTLQNKEFHLNSGDVFVVYSDGITEAENNEKEQFGLQRLEDVIRKYCGLNAEQIKNKIIKEVYNFKGETEIYDDITLMVIKQN